MLISTLDGTIVEANPACCTMHGYTCSELIGRRVATLIDPESATLSDPIPPSATIAAFTPRRQLVSRRGARDDLHVQRGSHTGSFCARHHRARSRLPAPLAELEAL